MKIPRFTRSSVLLVTGLGGLCALVNVSVAQPFPWTPLWGAVATSADGRTMVAAARGAYYNSIPAPIYVSTNAGGSWVQTTAPTNGWSSVVCSADGRKLVAATQISDYRRDYGLIYTSPNAGKTWTAAGAPTNNWTCLASSGDGARLVAVSEPFWDEAATNYVGRGAIYHSSDGGATWSKSSAPDTNYWSGVASSADGMKLVAVSEGDGIYRSLDGGATWNRTSAPSAKWSCVASSVDGVRLVAAVNGGLVYTSVDSGATWAETSAPTNYWSSVCSSLDGTKLVAASYSYSGIYASSDAGTTWTAMGAPIIPDAVACSADGYRLVAASVEQIWTWPYSGPWRLAGPTPSAYGSIACSADGTKLVAAGSSGSIYRSSDSAATWTQTSAQTDGYWSGIASSADGGRLVAVSRSLSDPPYTGGAIYSSPNGGGTWIRTSAPGSNWISVASSADGTNLVALAAPLWSGSNYLGGGAIYRSRDSGVSWIAASAPSNVWTSVATSADGTKLVAGGARGVYLSSDAGETWTPTSLPTGLAEWRGWSVASSADGAKLVAATDVLWDPAASNYTAGAIYRSSNAGATWVRTSAPTGEWIALASSLDGTVLCAVRDDFWGPEISTNSGATWAPANVPAGWWNAVASSADGSFLIMAGSGQIATLHSPAPAPLVPPSPQLAIVRSGSSPALSWLVPSAPFVLQGNFDLGSAMWANVPTTPILNTTNLHYELTLPPTSGSTFYRLRQQ